MEGGARPTLRSSALFFSSNFHTIDNILKSLETPVQDVDLIKQRYKKARELAKHAQ